MITRRQPAKFAIIISSTAAVIALLAPLVSAADTTQAANADELQPITIPRSWASGPSSTPPWAIWPRSAFVTERPSTPA